MRDLTLVSNNAGNLGKGLATWLQGRHHPQGHLQLHRRNEDLHTRMASGEVKVEITPQGTLAERMRAAGAGIPAFFTPTGVGTVVEEGKETREIDGRRYLLERALPGDVALVRAQKSDRFGNLRFWRTGAQLQPGDGDRREADDRRVRSSSSTNGAIDPDDVHLPGIYVHRIVHVPEHENAFEYKTTRKRP